MDFVHLILIGISLSMDAFSLSMIYGTLNLERKSIVFLSFLVGVFHFFMPILGGMIGSFVLASFFLHPDHFAGIIFLILAFEMLFNSKELGEKKVSFAGGFWQAILFAFSVSLDSFSVGIGLSMDQENMILCGVVFSLISAMFTYVGLKFGKKLSLKFGKIANVIGSILLFLLGLQYLFSF